MMNNFTWIFIAALAAGLVLQLWLIYRQRMHVMSRRAEVPEAFRAQIPLADHQKAADYTDAKLRLTEIELVVSTLLIGLWTLGGGLHVLDQFWRALAWSPLATGVAFIISAVVIMALLALPFSIYRTFVIEQRFGFNRTTPRLFATDLLKETVMQVALIAPLSALALWLMAASGDLWWLYVWLLWAGFILLLNWAYPTLIAPLFNKFEPLTDEALRLRIQALLQKCGFTSNGIFVMDGSRRSGHGNAYFTGLGTNKRIVFFDTLLTQLQPAEIEAVLAHELGHFKRKHVQKNLCLMLASSLLGLALLGWLIDQAWFYTGLGVQQPSLYTALMLFLLVVPVFSLFLQPVFIWLSRRDEFEADNFAAEQSDARVLAEALVKLYKESADTLTPDIVYSAFHDAHPPPPVRVEHLLSKVAAKSVCRGI